MRLLRLHLRNFAGVRSRTVDLQPRGVTVLVGPNEVGKSTLLAALDLLVRFPDSSRAQEVRDAQPAGQDVGPRVEAVMTSPPYQLTYAKQWLKEPQTTLRVAAPAGTEILTGREAHGRAEAIFAETLDRDLWDALRVQQGQLANRYGAHTSLGRSTSLREALDRAAGGNLGGRAEYGLLERVTDERGQFLTETGHARGAYREAAKRVDEARAAAAELGTRLSDVERLLAEIPRLQADVQRIDRDRAKALERLAELRARHDAVRAQEAELARREAQVAIAEGRHAGVRQDQANRQALTRAAEAAAAHLADLRLRAESAPDISSLLAAREAAHQAWTERRQAAEAATALRLRAQTELDVLRDRAAMQALDQRLARAQDARARLGEASALLAAVTLTPEGLSRLEEAQRGADRAHARLEVGAARLEVAALADVDLRIGPDDHRLANGQSVMRNVPDSLEVLVPGLLRVRVRGGGEAARLRQGAEAAQAELQRLLADAGQPSLPAARAALEARRTAEAAAKLARADLTAALGGQGLDDLVAERARLATRSGDQAPVLDLPQAEAARGQAESAEREALLALERARQHEEKAMRAAQDAEVQVAVLRSEVQQAEAALASAEDSLRRARSEQADAAIAEALAGAAGALEAARSAHREARAAYEGLDPAQVNLLWANQEKVVAGLDGQQRAAERDLDRAQDHLRLMEGEGLQEAYEQAGRELERAEREHTRLRRLAEAADLLFRTLRAHRERMLRDYQAPYREAIEQLGRVVFGAGFAVELNEDLDIARRTLDGQSLEFRLLSTGAQEQLAVLARLAAATLASGDGVPVILDDAFGYSDPERLEMLGAVLASLGDRCQVIALTCFPERYQGVGGARVVRIGPALDGDPRREIEAGAREVAPAAPPAPAGPVDGLTAPADSLPHPADGLPPSGGHPSSPGRRVRPSGGEGAPLPGDRVLACLRAAPQPLGKQELLAAAGLAERDWTRVIGDLVRSGRVERVGAKRGATYRVPGG